MKTNKWYVAVKASHKSHVDIIKDTNEPTAARYPQYAYMFGGYRTQRKAIQVAMYHNFGIDTPQPNKL
jgi:hypothetical protein